MLQSLNNFFKNNATLLILCLFPVCVLLRSSAINLFFVCISLIFLFQFKNYKNFFFEKWVIIFFIFITYTSFISFFSQDQLASLRSSVSQLRFILFVIFLSLLRIDKYILKKIINFTMLIIIFVCFDVFYQYFYGHDIFGFEPGDPKIVPDRLSGPFNQELIVGAYIYYISIPLISHYFYNFKKKILVKKFAILLFSCLVFFTVLISGERMAFILFSASLLIILIINFNYKKVLFFLTVFCLLTTLIFNLNKSVNNRVVDFFKDISNFQNSNHYKLFASAVGIWKDHPLIGTGLKNFRVVCDQKKINYITKENYICSTHPHNTYFELLVETGLIGIFIFLFFFITLVKNILIKFSHIDQNFKGFFLGSFIILLMYFWPIKSSGSIFSTFNASFMWFNIGIISLILNSKKNKFVK